MNNWGVYILECKDGSLYTGITTDFDRRVHEHNIGKGAKYTRGRRPVKMIYCTQKVFSRSLATKLEIGIKKQGAKHFLEAIVRRKG